MFCSDKNKSGDSQLKDGTTAQGNQQRPVLFVVVSCPAAHSMELSNSQLKEIC